MIITVICRQYKKYGYTLFWKSTLDILLTMSNYMSTTCQLILINLQLHVY